MLKKILTLSLLLCALCLQGFSQEKTEMKPEKTEMKNEMKNEMSMADKTVTPQEAAKNALNVGAKMPKFSLSDATGKTVSSENLLKEGNLVIVFYRGAWCPYCNAYLKKMEKNLTQIKAAGGTLVAISVENPDNSMTVAKKNELEYTVLSDTGLKVAREFGIVYELPKETSEKYKSRGLDLAKYNGIDKPELPLSATYVVNQKGEIVYAFLEPDYTKRAEPEAVIESLSKIKPAMEMKK